MTAGGHERHATERGTKASVSKQSPKSCPNCCYTFQRTREFVQKSNVAPSILKPFLSWKKHTMSVHGVTTWKGSNERTRSIHMKRIERLHALLNIDSPRYLYCTAHVQKPTRKNTAVRHLGLNRSCSMWICSRRHKTHCAGGHITDEQFSSTSCTSAYHL